MLNVITRVVARAPLVCDRRILSIEIDTVGKRARGQESNVAVVFRPVPCVSHVGRTKGAEVRVVVIV